MIDHSSASRFSTGVPVSATRWAARGARGPPVPACAAAFLIVLRLVEHDARPGDLGQRIARRGRQGVGGEQPGRPARRASANGRPGQRARPRGGRARASAGREPLGLALPVADHRRRADQQRRAGAAAPPSARPSSSASTLDRLAQAHVVGQAGAEPEDAEEAQPGQAAPLVGAQPAARSRRGVDRLDGVPRRPAGRRASRRRHSSRALGAGRVGQPRPSRSSRRGGGLGRLPERARPRRAAGSTATHRPRRRTSGAFARTSASISSSDRASPSTARRHEKSTRSSRPTGRRWRRRPRGPPVRPAPTSPSAPARRASPRAAGPRSRRGRGRRRRGRGSGARRRGRGPCRRAAGCAARRRARGRRARRPARRGAGRRGRRASGAAPWGRAGLGAGVDGEAGLLGRLQGERQPRTRLGVLDGVPEAVDHHLLLQPERRPRRSRVRGTDDRPSDAGRRERSRAGRCPAHRTGSSPSACAQSGADASSARPVIRAPRVGVDGRGERGLDDGGRGRRVLAGHALAPAHRGQRGGEGVRGTRSGPWSTGRQTRPSLHRSSGAGSTRPRATGRWRGRRRPAAPPPRGSPGAGGATGGAAPGASSRTGTRVGEDGRADVLRGSSRTRSSESRGVSGSEGRASTATPAVAVPPVPHTAGEALRGHREGLGAHRGGPGSWCGPGGRDPRPRGRRRGRRPQGVQREHALAQTCTEPSTTRTGTCGEPGVGRPLAQRPGGGVDWLKWLGR